MSCLELSIKHVSHAQTMMADYYVPNLVSGPQNKAISMPLDKDHLQL